MKRFDAILNEQLESVNLTGELASRLDYINELVKEIDNTKNSLAELELRLRDAIEDYNIELAKELRRSIPQLGVNLNDGKCSIAYKSTCLSCRPDVNNKLWVFDQNKHGRRFTKKYGLALRLDNSVENLANAIVQYLTGRYKSLS